MRFLCSLFVVLGLFSSAQAELNRGKYEYLKCVDRSVDENDDAVQPADCIPLKSKFCELDCEQGDPNDTDLRHVCALVCSKDIKAPNDDDTSFDTFQRVSAQPSPSTGNFGPRSANIASPEMGSKMLRPLSRPGIIAAPNDRRPLNLASSPRKPARWSKPPLRRNKSFNARRLPSNKFNRKAPAIRRSNSATGARSNNSWNIPSRNGMAAPSNDEPINLSEAWSAMGINDEPEWEDDNQAPAKPATPFARGPAAKPALLAAPGMDRKVQGPSSRPGIIAKPNHRGPLNKKSVVTRSSRWGKVRNATTASNKFRLKSERPGARARRPALDRNRMVSGPRRNPSYSNTRARSGALGRRRPPLNSQSMPAPRPMHPRVAALRNEVDHTDTFANSAERLLGNSVGRGFSRVSPRVASPQKAPFRVPAGWKCVREPSGYSRGY